jgi:hypothetical protein
VELLVTRTRFFLALLAAALAAGPALAGPGLFKSKPKPDATRARALIETLKSDPDEKKRKAAAGELGAADARTVPEVVPALTAALQKDAAASVRAEAADALRELNQVFPVAGVALEGAAAGDASLAVRLAAKKALWEYHLNGYHSPKGSDEVAAQTVEPPIASPAGPRPAAAVVPAPPPPPAVTPLVPPLPAAVPLPPALPPVVPPVGPRVSRPLLADFLPGPRAALRAALNPSLPARAATVEPPLAKPPATTISIPPPTPDVPAPPTTVAAEPPALLAPRVPDYIPTLPPFTPDLPPVVLPPDAFPVPTIPKPPATLAPLK